MKYIPDSSQMKEADQFTIQTLGIASLELMENAALSCVEFMQEKKLDLSNVCVICGSGNNGGDGFAIARILAKKKYKVTVVMAGQLSRATEETVYQIDLLSKAGISYIEQFEPDDYSIIIDAIFGVGLSRNVEGHFYKLIEKMNQSMATKIAVDIPSGINADNGSILGIAFRADYTVTFQTYKTGLLFYPGKEYAGEIIVKNIGISESYFKNNETVSVIFEKNDYKKFLPKRVEDSHKGTYGKLLIIAGSKGMSGAAYLNAYAAYRSGAGLVQIYTPEDNRIILQQLLPEAIITTYECYNENQVKQLINWSDTICIGSGIGISKVSQNILKTVILESKVPCVIDADGLNILADHIWYLEKRKHNAYILTPHMKEMAGLIKSDIQSIKTNRKSIIESFIKLYEITCVLKDSITVIKSYNERMVINQTGNQAMAKAGSGDVLAGIIAGMLVQVKSCFESAVLGTYIHGCCGDKARSEMGSYSVLARDLIENIPIVLKREVE